MPVENLGKCITLPAATDLSSSQYCFVDVNSSGQAALAGLEGHIVGVLQDDPAAAGRPASVMVGAGITKVKAGGTCTRGGSAQSDAYGRAIDATSGGYIVGTFLEAATTANTYVTLLFQPEPAQL